MSIWKSQRASLLVALTAMLLVVLAVLQYRWVGELSEFEYRRMQRTLRASAEGFARDFEREIRRIRSAFEIRRSRGAETELPRAYGEWADSSEAPEMIASVYWLAGNPANPDVSLQQLHLQDRMLMDTEWPAWMAPLREAKEYWRPGGDRNRQRLQRGWAEQVGAGFPAVIVPQEDRRDPAWSIVLLRNDILTEKLIPSLVERYFGPDDQRDYDIWIAEDDDPDSVLYTSAGAMPLSSPAEADHRTEISDDLDWTLSARHQAGSLETFVSQYRQRNLSLGIGTVLVLGASFIILLVATRRAQWLADRQMEFVAGVSHELRTPIAGISSLSQNLADGVVRDSRQVVRYGESINNESRRLKDMVEKVLHFAAVRSGHRRYVLLPVDLPSVVEKELDAISRYSDGASPAVLNVDGDVPPVLGDEQALRSVVRNLVSNAIKFGNESNKVRISVRRAHADAGEVELQVEDRGAGIASSDLVHIFEPFYRGKGAQANQVGGSGLGLSLVWEIVRAHRGRTEVDTETGKGSTFRVYLPVATEENDGNSS